MIELVRDLRVTNVLAKFENDPWKSMDVRVLTGLVCPAARPLGVRQYPGALKGCGVKSDLLHGTVHYSTKFQADRRPAAMTDDNTRRRRWRSRVNIQS